LLFVCGIIHVYIHKWVVIIAINMGRNIQTLPWEWLQS